MSSWLEALGPDGKEELLADLNRANEVKEVDGELAWLQYLARTLREWRVAGEALHAGRGLDPPGVPVQEPLL